MENETKEKQEEQTPEDAGNGDITESTSLIENANEAAERLEEANKRQEELIKRQEALLVEQKLSGKSEAGAIVETKEETPEES